MIIRHLILPANTNSSLECLGFLKAHFPDTQISLMAQYTPCGDLQKTPEINRRITQREYDKVTDCALALGMEKVFVQKLSSSGKNFIPPFDFSGIMC
jgi:putative pyruvate formate lyase activating enzyme